MLKIVPDPCHITYLRTPTTEIENGFLHRIPISLLEVFNDKPLTFTIFA